MKKEKPRKKQESIPEQDAPQPENAPPVPESGHEQEAALPTMVALTMEEYEYMQKQLEETTKQAREFQEGWSRERADLQNYRRRVEREQEQLAQSISGNVIRKYLPILDDIERAVKACPPEGLGMAWGEGVALIARKLNSLLEAEGVRPIPAQGQFDAALHEAITHEDHPNFASGQIIEVVQQGYTIGDRVLRPALVRVAR